jgi:3,4-dihydroxy 2-butanone 4-phosphate synthase/GTP cyclohydrolase II
VSTGISAHDRAHTVSVAIDPTKDHRDIMTPGHVFPLVAKEGGVLVRAGHTEAAVDLARLAGLYPAGVICEIMNDDGTMARLPDLIAFAERHGLKIAAIADLIAYRLRYDHLVKVVAQTKVDSPYGGVFDLKVYATTVDTTEHVALVKGDVASGGPVLVRVHALNTIDDVVATGERRETLVHKAMEIIGREGRGVVVLIRESRPDAISARLNQEASGAGQQRLIEYGIGAQILLDLGVHEMVLLSNSPARKIVGLEGYGLKVVGHRGLE